MTELVFDIKTASRSDVRALSNHCEHRTQLGKSRIDPSRTHLNRRLHGGEGTVDQELAAWFKRTGAKKPAKQASTPYLTFVLSLSPDFYKNDPKNTDRFNELAMEWLQEEFGDDLVLAELHLDETTPHIHAMVAPTYEKKKRIPGRQKKNETEEQFEARREAARNGPGDRTVGWSSSKYRYDGSIEDMRRSLVAKLEPLSVNYGTPGKKPKDWKTWMNELATKMSGKASKAVDYIRQAKRVLKTTDQALAKFQELTGKIRSDQEDMKQMFSGLETKVSKSSMSVKEKDDFRKYISATKEHLDLIEKDIELAEKVVAISNDRLNDDTHSSFRM